MDKVRLRFRFLLHLIRNPASISISAYQNGDNDHTADIVLPITLGDNKKAAIPVVNNVELASSGTSYTLTGDVNNAGLTDAKSMVVTVGAPAKAVEPYAQYAIGSLAADDFSSFEITFTSNRPVVGAPRHYLEG